MNKSAEEYFIDGCGRCKFAATPRCKVNKWQRELQLLRSILLDSELKEDCKWGVPCYTLNGKNVVILSALKDYCTLAFFKGILMEDKYQLLQKPGENSEQSRVLKFTNEESVINNAEAIEFYINEAVRIEKSGKKLPPNNSMPQIPNELETYFDENAMFKTAFQNLTLGKQKAYIIYFNSSAKPETRKARIEKYIPEILKGKGINDNYIQSKKKSI